MEEKINKAMEFGASRQTACFLASTERSDDLYRVRYGYINENDLGDFTNSKMIDCPDYGSALDTYKALAWIRTYDGKGRRFIRIEKSSDKGKNYKQVLFHDCQH